MKNLFLFLFIFLLRAVLTADSLYFYEAFDTSASVISNWYTNFRYGRSGIYFPSPDGENANLGRSSEFSVSNHQLVFSGAVQSHWEFATSTDDYTIGYWCGNTIKLTNANGQNSFHASAVEPFGFTVLRTRARLDPDNELYSSGKFYEDNIAGAVEGTVWLVEDTGIDPTVEGGKFDNAACLYEMFRYGVNKRPLLGDGGFRSTWGYYIFSETRFDLENVSLRNQNINLVSHVTYGLERNYEDKWEGNNNSDYVNTNAIGLKITHNGSFLRFYINPNPLNNPVNPYPNEYCLLSTTPVTWSSNLRPMLGHGSHWHTTESEDVHYDDFLIRSVARSGKLYISPDQVFPDKETLFTIHLVPDFSIHDSGIGELKITKTDSYKNSWKDIKVFTEWGDLTNNHQCALLKSVKNGFPSEVNEVFIKTNRNQLKIFFCLKSDKKNGVIKYGVKKPEIKVEFKLKTPQNPGSPDKAFSVYANCRKYGKTGYTKVCTTADKRFMPEKNSRGYFNNTDLVFDN